MKAIIPVAGIGTRMRPHTHTQPKVLLQVADKPMLDHIIDALVDAGVDGITLVVGYLGDMIVEHVRRTHPGLTLNVVPQKEMLGLGHAISLTREFHAKDDRLLIILGDTIVQMDFKSMFTLKSGALAVKAVEDPRRFGTVELDATGRITRVIEKAENPPTNLAIVGVYLIDNPAMLYQGLDHIIANNIKTKSEYQLTDALQYMLDRGDRMVPFTINGWLDCGKPETLLETNRTLLGEHCTAEVLDAYRRRYPSSVIVPPVFIGDGATIENAIVGPYVAVAANATIDRAILRDCTVAKGATLRALHLRESMIGEAAEVVGHSVSVNIGDHSVISLM